MKNSILRAITTSLFAATLVLPMQASAWWGPSWGNNYGPGYSSWGPFDGFGDGFADMNFNMSFSGNARNRFNGSGYAHPAYGYGYGYPYPYAPVAYTVPVVSPAPAAPAIPEPVVELDGDADGIVDLRDLCPASSAGAKVDAFGCEVDAAIVLRGVNFHTDSDQLTEQSLAILNTISETLTANPEIRVEVAGHTDSQGEDLYNKDLSQRRAVTVVDYLVNKGVNSDNLKPAGYGEESPMADNATTDGRAENRRVELVRLDG